MAVTVERLKVDLAFDPSELRKGFASAGKTVKNFGSQVSGLKNTLLGLAGGFVGFQAIKGFISHIADTGSELVDMSDRTGLSVESLSAFKYAVEQSGASLADFETGVRKMQKASQSKQGAKIFDKIGMDVEEFKKLDPHEQMVMLAEGIGKIEDPGQKAAAAMEVFGKSGTKLIPLFNDGAAAMQDLMQKAQDLGLVMSTEDAKAAEEFGDSLQMLKAVGSRVVTIIGSALVPTLNAAAQSLSGMAVAVREGFNATVEFVTGLWAEFGPYIVETTQAAWTFVTEVFELAWFTITTVTQTGMDFLSSLFGGDGIGIGSWSEFIQLSLLTIAFAFENWKSILILACLNVQHWVIKTGNEISWVFTNVVGPALTWVAENFVNVFKDMFNFITTIFDNIGKNIWTFFKNIPGLIAGTTSFTEIWTPLTEGFETAVSEFPAIVGRVEGDLEQSVREQAESLKESIGQDFDAFIGDKIQKIKFEGAGNFGATGDFGDAPALSDDDVDAFVNEMNRLNGGSGGEIAKGDGKGSDENKALQFGSADALSAVAKFRNNALQGDKTADKQLKEAELTNEKLDRIGDALEDLDGLNLAEL